MEIPTLRKYMTPMPKTIGVEIPIIKAYEMMKERSCRHLPVRKEGKLVGIISDRDVKLASSFIHEKNLIVEDLMTPDPYTVNLDDDLRGIVVEMAEKKYGCAVVEDSGGKLVGIFTIVDALKAFGDTLSRLN